MRAPALCLSTLALLAACQAQDTSPVGGVRPEGPAPTVTHPTDEWPGGSLGGFETEGDLQTRQNAGNRGWTDGDSSGEEYAGMADGAAAEGDYAAPSDGREPVAPDPAPPPPAHAGGLEGGEIDDNEDFEAFLAYLDEAQASLGQDPMIHPVDVAERHVITVRDATGETVPDATVRIFDEATQVTWGRTRADGRFAFFPGAYGVAADKFLVQAELQVGDLEARAAGTLQTGDETFELAFDEDVTPAAPRLDVAFVIDCTGSMGEEIDRIKTTVTDIAARVAADPSQPDLRLGLVAYRDQGDDFVTRTVNFTNDVTAFQGAIDALEANGGGDLPEALNEALHETMRGLEWRDQGAVRLAFVVADAPAHFYEQAQYTYDRAMLDAATMGVKLFPIASGGSDPYAELQFRQLAQFTLGHFVFITEGGGSSTGSGGSDYNVDPQDFRVEALDDLVVRLVGEELAAFSGL